MHLRMACLFIATQYETKWRGEIVGWPCSIKDLGDDMAEITAPKEAFLDWELRCKTNSPSVHWL